MTQALEVRNGGGDVMPIDPTDAKAWELVGSVLTWMGENACYNYSEAFRQLRVAPASYYRAIKRPFVQGRLAVRMDALDAAVAQILDMRWTMIVANMARLAQGDGREAVQAARFLAQEKDRIRQQGEAQKEAEKPGMHEATRWLQRVKEQGKVRAKRTTVVEEIEVAPGEGPRPILPGRSWLVEFRLLLSLFHTRLRHLFRR
jgi:hypothetical protein